MVVEGCWGRFAAIEPGQFEVTELTIKSFVCQSVLEAIGLTAKAWPMHQNNDPEHSNKSTTE